MPSLQPERRRVLTSARSRLGQSLLRLHNHMQQNRQQETVETAYTAWRDSWSHCNDQLAWRLELIESKLDDLARRAESEPACRLSVVGVPADADEMTAMRPF